MLLQRHGRSKKLANSACWTTSWPRFNLTGSSHCYQTGTQLLHSLLLVSLTLLLSSATQAVAVQFPQNFTPSTYPLAVKSTYLNAWISTQFNASDSSTSTLTHEAPKPNFGLDLGWCGMMRVDGEAWQWLGPISPNNVSTVKSTSIQGSIFTPTKIIFQMLAGPVTLNVTFLTPIETEDLTRQSLPFIYISLDVQSSDGQSHDVQVYSDITAEWVSGDRANTTVQWNTTFTSSSMFHRSFPQNPEPFNESNFQPQDGTVYYAMQQVQGLTWKTGEADVLRAQFLESGSLDNGEDTNFRTINSSFPAFAISVNLGNIQSTSQPIVWGLGLVRDPIVQYTLPSGGIEMRRPYFYSDSRFSSQRIEDVIDFFISDYDAAVQRSDNLDVKVREDVAASVSAGNEDEYFSLVSLSTRQLLANFELTFGTSSQDDGGVDIKAFARNTGVSALANNVPTLWGSFPVFLYLNATWAKYLLDSTLQYQHSFVYGKNYAAPDLGGNYPTEVQGNNKADETNSVKDTGLMLIMTLAYTKSAGDIEFLRKYYDTLKSWADYLTHKSFPPVNQQSGDLIGFASDDNSIIAIKGIIGIGAMAQIANAVGKLNDASVYSEASSSLAQQWQEQAVKSDHISLNYNNPRSFALVYDLYADLLLGTGLVNNSVYDIHTEFCQTQLSNAITSGANFGIQLTSQIAGEARSSWTMLVAATLTNNNTRNALVHGVYNRATFNQSGNRNFPLIYNIETGKPLESSCPAQGAMFSLLALQKGTKGFSDTNSTNSDPNQPDPPLKPKSGTGIIAGAVIGSLLGIALIVAAFVFFRRRKQRLQAQRRLLVPHSYPDPQLSMSMSAPPPQRSKMSTQPSASTAESSSSGVPSYRRKNRFTATPQPVPELAAAGTPPEEPSDTTQLRNDVSLLRREIEEIRQQREYDVPPPVYT